MMMKCREVTHLVSSDEVRDIGWMKRLELRLHLLMCRHCHNYVAQIRSLGRGARDLADRDATPPERLREIEGEIIDQVREGRD